MLIVSSFLSVLLSAVLLSLGIPNELFKLGSALFGLVALVPLYLAMEKTVSWRRAGFLGGLMMMLVHLLSSFWLANFKEFAIFTLGGSALLNFGFGFLVGALMRYALSFPKYLRPFLFAAVWTIWEWFKSVGFLAYPWGTLVMTSRDLVPLIQIADITGTWGISFLMALVSATVAETILLFQSGTRTLRRLLSRPAVFALALIALACSYGLMRLAFPPKPETSLNIVMVQQNADPWAEGGVKKNIITSQRLTREALAKSGKKADLIIWSESVLAFPYLENREYYAVFPKDDPLGKFLAETNTPLLVGSPVLVDPANEGYSNSVILLSPTGEQLDWFGKIQLVAFAEYMPFTEYQWVRKFFDSIVGFSRGWVPGKELKSFAVTNSEGVQIRFATPICFEDAFSSLIARLHNTGSDVLINLTNDSWSRTDSAEYQHFAIASFRSIELRTTLIRSTNAGYSAVINPLGRVTSDMPLFEGTARYVSVPIYPHTTTFYARFGDWFPSLLGLLILIAGIFKKYLDRRDSLR